MFSYFYIFLISVFGQEFNCVTFDVFYRFLNDTEIAKAQRDFELKKAAYDVEVQTKVSDEPEEQLRGN